jgi:glycine/D-amino acid oxidase-like deaminating enzyme
MIIDPSGVYFHPEATFGLAGFADPSEVPGMNYAYDPQFFEEKIWPPLAERASAFEKLKHVSGWAGQYEVSPDHSAILGAVEGGSPGSARKLFEAHSFSGHGIMQSHAAGEALAQKMLGREVKINVDPLSGSRFQFGQTVKEVRVI